MNNNISGNAGSWIKTDDTVELQERNKEPINTKDEIDELLKIQAKLFTKHLKNSNKNIGDSIIVLDSVIKSLELDNYGSKTS